MRFLIDAQLPPALARALRERDITPEHLSDLGLCAAKDREVWDYALKHSAALIPKDEDFVQRFRHTFGGPAIIWLRAGNCSNRALLALVLSVLDPMLRRLATGDRLIEVR